MLNDTYKPLWSSLSVQDRPCPAADPIFIIIRDTADDVILVASIAATVVNIMVIFCAIKLFKRSGDTMHLFIRNMTVGDLVLTIFCHPNELLIRQLEFLQQKHLCAVVQYFKWIGFAVSGLSLTLLNIDKLIYFRWPLHYDRTMSKRRATLFCLAIWAVSMGTKDRERDWFRGNITSKKFYYDIFTMLFCVLPVTSSLIVSIYLFNLTKKKRNSGNCGDTSAFKNKVKSLAFIFATTVSTSCCLLPYGIVNLASLYYFRSWRLTCMEKEITWVFFYLLILNPILNPFITSLIYAPYRLIIKKFFVKMFVGNLPSFVSVRHARNRRSSCMELASLRQSTVVVRKSMGVPQTPLKSDDGSQFKKEKKMISRH